MRTNIQKIADLEAEHLNQRSLAERVGDRLVASGTGTGTFPVSALTMIVSLEAIFITIGVLISQKRMARQADRRAHLDLQINLLAEQESTAALRLLGHIAERLASPRSGRSGPEQASRRRKPTPEPR